MMIFFTSFVFTVFLSYVASSVPSSVLSSLFWHFKLCFVLAVISLVSLGPRLRHFIIRMAAIARCVAHKSGQL
jgi:hypothetical protein